MNDSHELISVISKLKHLDFLVGRHKVDRNDN